MMKAALQLILLLRIVVECADNIQIDPGYQDEEIIGPISQITLASTPETVSPLTSASNSPESTNLLLLDHHQLFFTTNSDQQSGEGRPRKSSFNSHSTPRKSLHVSFGWVQFSDDRWMPSNEMEDNKENRNHIKSLMLTDARHGNLEYFKELANVLTKFDSKTLKTKSLFDEEDGFELDVYNPKSLTLAAVQSDNVEILEEVMKFKGITISDLNPCKIKSPKTKKKGTFLTSFIDSDSEDSYDDCGDFDDCDDCSDCEGNVHLVCTPIDETIFGKAISHNSISILKYFIDQGIKDEYPEKSETALHYAIQSNHELIVNLLLLHGNSIVDRCNGAFQSPLMAAVLVGNSKIVKVILSRNPNLLITDINRRNVLHLAAHVGNLEILGKLLQAVERLLPSIDERNELVLAEDLNRNSVLHYATNENVYSILVHGFGAVEGVKNSAGLFPKYTPRKYFKRK